MSDWYYTSGGQQNGPVSSTQLRQLAQSGRMRRTDLIWKDGMPDWKEAGAVSGLFPAAAAPTQQFAPAPPASAPSEAAAQPSGYAAVPPGAGVASAPAGEPPNTLSYHSGASPVYATPRALEMLRQTRPWVMTIGILTIIGGGIYILAGIVMVVGMAAMSSRSGSGTAGYMAGQSFGSLLAGGAFVAMGFYLTRYGSRIKAVLDRQRSEDLEAALEAQKTYWRLVGIVMIVMFFFVVLAVALAIILR